MKKGESHDVGMYTNWKSGEPNNSGEKEIKQLHMSTDRFPEGQHDLPTQNMKHVGRSGAVGNHPIAVIQLIDNKVLIQGLHIQ